jgi:hypothetical protein
MATHGMQLGSKSGASPRLIQQVDTGDARVVGADAAASTSRSQLLQASIQCVRYAEQVHSITVTCGSRDWRNLV